MISSYLATVPTALATPAAGPGAVSRVIAGALASGTIPDGTCRAKVTAAGGGGASAPTAAGLGGIGGAGASISATYAVLPLQTYQGSVGGGGGTPTGGTGNGAVGTGGTGGTVGTDHRGGGGGGRTTVDLGGSTVLIAGGGGGGGAAHQAAPAGVGGGGGFAGIGAGAVAVGVNGRVGVDTPNTANGGTGGQTAAGGAGGTNSGQAARNGAAGGGIGIGTGGNGGPDANYDSGGGGGGGYTGGGGGASTVNQTVTGAGGGGGSSWVSATSPVVAVTAPTSISGVAGTASPTVAGVGATGSIAIDWLPCLYTLSISKSVSSATVNAGGSVIWTVAVTNTGPDPMTRGDTVDLADTLPVGPNGSPAPAYKVLSMTVAGGSNANMSRGAVTCTGVAVGSSMPASTVCSRAYSAPSAPQAPSGGLRGLDPGETITITYEQIIANTAPCATITNTATTTDRATQTGTVDITGVAAARTASASLTIACYDLAITKVASPKPGVRPGGTVTWTITVTNNGPGAMVGPAASDANPLVITDTFPSIGVGLPVLVSSVGPAGACNRVGNTITCAAGLPAAGIQVLTYTQSVNAGATDGTLISNTATVSDPKTGDSNDSSTDSTTVRIPGLTLVKSALPTTYATVGTVVNYSYLVSNTGTLGLAGPVSVADNKVTVSCPAVSTVGNHDAVFDPAETMTCTASHTITQTDLDAGSITNTATASADAVNSNLATVTVTAVQTRALTLVKSALPTTYATVGTVVNYSYLVTNTGNVTLAGPFSVADNKVTVTCPPTASLAPGAAITCTAAHTITQADLDSGSITNTASATNGTTTSNLATVTVTAVQTRALTLVKSALPTTYATVGTVVNYSYLVTNTGNVTLTGPFSVTDDQVSVTCPPTPSLAPGANVTCTAAHTIDQTDLDAGSITNIASASNGFVTSNTDSETVTAIQTPELSLDKSATPSTYAAVGDTISYSYLVTNSGNVTLTGPFTVADDQVTVTCPPTPSLAPGANVTCTASYAITQTDLDAGSITNIASASNGFVTSNTDSATVTAIQTPELSLDKSATPSTYAAVGDTISYSYLVTNSGNVTLTGPFSVTDDQVSVTCPPTPSLAPGANVTCTASYAITQTDLDAGSITNIASASNGFVTSNTDSETVTAIQTPELSLDKSATPSTYAAVGDTISYSYLVTNSGNVTLTGPFTVADDQVTVTCPSTASLAPGASATCTAADTIDQADLDAGSLTNTASASNGTVTSNTDTATVTAIQTPELTLDKSATPSTYAVVGDVISYSYLVTNSGNVTLTGPFTVADDQVTVTCPSTASLAPGASVTCTAAHTIDQTDLDAGSITNTASASNGFVTSNTDSETVTAIQTPELTLDKSATPSTYAVVGDTISYSYLVTNSGNVTLTGPFSVTDDQVSVTCPPTPSLAPGANVTCTASYAITQTDLDAGSITNIASASNGFVTSNTDSATVTAIQTPELSLDKSATPSTYAAVGDTISYSYLVTNSGNVTLTGPFTVADDQVTVTCPSTASLAPGAAITCTAAHTIDQTHLDAGSLTNTASASNGFVTSNTDSETVTAIQTPELTLDKSATPSTYAVVGDTISYSYLVTNSGNVTLTGPFTVADDQVSVTCPPTPSLAPGANVTCTASYAITQTDLDAGSITNIASASNGFVTSNTDSATVTAIQTPELSLDKSATPSTYAAVGDTISYSYLVTNSGNVTLTGPFSVTDDQVSVTCPPTPSLAPGANVTCTASYAITQTDLDAGSITNIASASNGFVTSNTDSATVTAIQTPELSLDKSATPSTYAAVGDTISYSYLVTNSGNVTLTGPFTVADDQVTVTCPSTASLAPGASATCTAADTIDQTDLDAGSLTNTASASNGTVTSNTDTATVTAVQTPELTLDKSATPSTYAVVGDVISYSYLVTNSGNVTLTGPFTVADDQVTVTCPSTASLAPGASVTCTAAHTIDQTDLDAGSITNTASATNGTITSPDDSVTVTAVQGAALSLDKSATPSTYAVVGDTISYSYLVTNSGNVTLTGPFSVTDDQVTVGCQSTASLAPGASITCTASDTITQADLDAGSLTNTASATNGSVTSPDDNETVTAVQGPALTLAKTATPSTYSAVGDTISYSYLVTNSGNVTLTGPFTVADDQVTVTCPATPSLAHAASITCTASHTIDQADLDAGSITNTASGSNGSVTSNTDTATVTAVQGPALTLAKAATPSTYSAVGNVIAYSYVVTNSGNVTLTGPFSVTDDKVTVTCPATPSLAHAASITCTASHIIDQADLDAGSITNTASATNGSVTSNTDTATVTAIQGPALSLDKSATPQTFAAVGTVISYDYLVTNVGTVTLTGPFSVTDDKVTVSCPSTASLAPGADLTCAASHTTTQGDLDAGSITNTASATNGSITSNTDSATVNAVQGPALTLAKTATPSTYSAVGNVISYSYLVTNSGTVTLAGPFSVTDDKVTVSCPSTASLAPGATVTCTASHTITQADLDAGSIKNIASATNGSVTSPDDTATVTAVQGPALTLAKSATPATYAAIGDTISYSYVVTNSGTITLAGPFSVADDQVTVSCPSSASLAPGASITCTASHSITQADLDAGSITNVASAANGTVTSNTDSVKATAALGPALTLAKSATPTSYAALGDTIDYRYVVTNAGNVSLDGPVTVADDKVTVTCPALSGIGDHDAQLDPGEHVTCTASHTITQADLDAGSIKNTATASAGGVDSVADTVTVTDGQGPAPTPTASHDPATHRPTAPPTDAAPGDTPRSPSDVIEWFIAAWLLLATLGALTGVAARRPGSTRGGSRGRRD